jgi:alkaline phosphatase D
MNVDEASPATPGPIRRRAFLGGLPGLLALVRRPSARRGPVLGVWSGAVAARGATVKVLAEGPGLGVDLDLSAEGMPSARRSQATDASGVAAFVLDGLRERTRYRYVVSTPGAPVIEGRFRTFADGPLSFRVLFASCAGTGSTSPVFTAMREQDADLFVHMGDIHYEDIGRNEVERFRRAYLAVHGSAPQSALFRSVPVAYTWDDHDFGPNDSDRTSPSREAALEAYRRFVPHYPLAADPGATIHQSFTVGRVVFLVTDCRAGRSPRRAPEPERTMLGREQLEWLLAQLDEARTAPLVVWVNSVPWITKRDESTREGWAPFARERERIADHVVRLGLVEKLVMLSGDAHMLAMDDGTHSQYSRLPGAPARGFAVAHAAPMDRRPSRKGGPYTHPEVAQNGQYGVMDVTDDGARVKVSLRGMRGGTEVPGMRLERP